jgi:hypothetical protein
MVYFKTKNPNLGKFGRVLQWKMLVYFMANLSILRSFGIVYGHLVHFMANWYIYSHFGMLYKEKSDNPAFNEDEAKCWIGIRLAIVCRR